MTSLIHEKHLDALVSFFQSWVPLADKTVYLTVPGMDQALAPLGETLGFDIGMLKVMWNLLGHVRFVHSSPEVAF
jgi:hypothetical protein